MKRLTLTSIWGLVIVCSNSGVPAVAVPCRRRAQPLLLAGALALALAGCGVKGPLEPPPRSQLAPQATQQAGDQGDEQVSAPGRIVYSESSSVQRRSPPSVLPEIPPPEWTRTRTQRQDGPPRRTVRPEKPDDPFFLDWLL